jgi:hypothetical protein
MMPVAVSIAVLPVPLRSVMVSPLAVIVGASLVPVIVIVND